MKEQIKHLVDGLSISTVIGSVMGWVPHIAAILSIIWTLIRIYETHTVQKLLAKWRGQ